MPIIIDGWNLIRDHRSTLKNQEPLDAVRSLIGMLQTFQARHNDPILLILDSKNECLPIHYRDSAKLQIVPTADADEFIKRYLDRTLQSQRQNVRVVSSDLDVYDYARSSRASAVKCSAFWNKLFGK